MNEGMKPLYDGCVGNREHWQQLADEQDAMHNEAVKGKPGISFFRFALLQMHFVLA